MTILRASTAFLNRIKTGEFRVTFVRAIVDANSSFVDSSLAAVGRGAVTSADFTDFSLIDAANRTLAVVPSTANARLVFWLAGRPINLNRECACNATPDLEQTLLALGFTSYTPAGASTAYEVPTAA